MHRRHLQRGHAEIAQRLAAADGLHRATPFANATEKRLMVRTTIAGNGPTLRRAA